MAACVVQADFRAWPRGPVRSDAPEQAVVSPSIATARPAADMANALPTRKATYIARVWPVVALDWTIAAPRSVTKAVGRDRGRCVRCRNDAQEYTAGAAGDNARK